MKEAKKRDPNNEKRARKEECLYNEQEREREEEEYLCIKNLLNKTELNTESSTLLLLPQIYRR